VDCCARCFAVAEGFEDAVEQPGNVFVGRGNDIDSGCEDDGCGCETVFDCGDGNFRSF